MLETKYIIMIIAFGVLVVYVLASIWLRNLKIQKKEKASKPKKEKKSRQPLFKHTKSTRVHKVRIKKDKQEQMAKVEHVYQPSAQPVKVEDLVAEQEQLAEGGSKPIIADVVKEERVAAQKQSKSDAYVTDFDELIARQRARRAEVARQREEMRKYFENRNNTGRASTYTPLKPSVKSSLDIPDENVSVSVHPSNVPSPKTMTRADYERVLAERKWGTDYSKFNQQTSTITDTDHLAESIMIGEVVAHAKSKNKKNTYFH